MSKLLMLIAIGVGFWFFAFRDPSESKLLDKFTSAVSPKVAQAAPPPPPAPVVPVSPPPSPVPTLQSIPPPSAGVVTQSGVAGSKPIVEGGLAFAPQSFVIPPVWASYAMKFRAAPSAEYFTQWSALGVEVVLEPVSRLISFRGPAGSVAAFQTALESIDTVPGSCCVQAWSVFVDKSAEKGFDLVAALGAVTGGETVVGLGPSGLTLNVSVDRVSAALDVIANGSTVEVLQAPYVRLLDGQPAKVESIEEIPTPETVVANGVAQTTVRFRKVGLVLDVTPAFFSSERLRLTVLQSNGVVGAPVRIGGNEVPTVQTQSVTASAEMTVGQTLVLGGVRTVRNITSKGLFRDVEQTSEGTLYVILSTYNDEPRAVSLEPAALVFPESLGDLPPLTESESDGVLPSKPWEDVEADFVRSKGAK